MKPIEMTRRWGPIVVGTVCSRPARPPTAAPSGLGGGLETAEADDRMHSQLSEPSVASHPHTGTPGSGARR